MSFNEEIKQKVLQKLKELVEPKQYETWLRDLTFIEEPNDVLKIPLPNFYYIEWYKKNYLSLIEQIVLELSGRKYTLDFIAPAEQGRLFPDDLIPRPKSSRKDSPVIASPVQTPPAGSKSVPQKGYDFTLNEHYVFDKFVVGRCNRLAQAAALAVAENPGKAYNPLFIHGGVGLGKTHLLQAIIYQIIAKHPNYSIYYRSGEGFVNDYISAVKNNTFEKFRQQCRSKDIMIIDDIHFLGSGEKAASQEEFFHTFNTLHNTQKQIVLSSDSPPKEIPSLEERLISRFNWGMVARLEPPDFETGVAILKRKAENYKIEMPDEVVKFMAEAINTNIRDLEGALIRVIGLARSVNQNPSLALATEALRDIIGSQVHHIKIGTITDSIASYFNLSVSEIQSKKRIKSVALARQIGFYLTRQLKPDLSLEEIGASFGGREHSTVLHAVEKVRKRAQKDTQFKETLNLLITDIKKKSV